MSLPIPPGPPHPPPPPGVGFDWQELYLLLGERVFRMLHRMMGDAETAADLAHDTFVRIHQCRDQYNGRGPIAGWVFRIAGNIGRDEIRKRATHARVEQLHAGISGPRAPLADLRLSLQDALADLEPGHRAVVLLHDVDGYTHREIAEMLNIAEGTSKARLSRGRQALRVAIGDD